MNLVEARNRTNQKLRYARVHLDELQETPDLGSNSDWENAHDESFWFHLIGAVENVFHEINAGYSLKLQPHQVKRSPIRAQLQGTQQTSPAFDAYEALRKKKQSWLCLLYELRNSGAHRSRPPKIVQLSTVGPTDNRVIDPSTGKEQTVIPDATRIDLYRHFQDRAESLISCCRKDPKL